MITAAIFLAATAALATAGACLAAGLADSDRTAALAAAWLAVRYATGPRERATTAGVLTAVLAVTAAGGATCTAARLAARWCAATSATTARLAHMTTEAPPR